MASLFNNFETFVPVLFILLFLLLLFLIYAINNLELRSKLCYLFYCCTCLCFKKKRKPTNYMRRAAPAPPMPPPPPPPPVRMMPPLSYLPAPPPMHIDSGYYEGPTAGYYRVGYPDPHFISNYNNHYHVYGRINPYANFPPQTMFMGLGGPGTGAIKLNQLYRSSEDGESFQLPPVTHLNSLSITSESEESSSVKIHRSCSTELTISDHQPNRRASRANGRASLYFNNNHMPSKIMSEHELKNYINYNSRLDANLVQNNLNNLVNLRQNFSEVNRLYSSEQVSEATIKENKVSTNNSVVETHHHHGRLRKKFFDSSNLFNGSSFRLSENNYTSLKNHSSPNHADSKRSLFSLDNECRQYDSEPMRLGMSRKSQRKNKMQPSLNSFSAQRQNYLRSINKLRKLSVSMNSLMEKATNSFNLSQIVRISNRNSMTSHQQDQDRASTLIEYDRLKDAAVQANLQPPNEKEALSSHSISHTSATNTTECSSGCSSSFSSSQPTSQLIQSNTYGSILGNFGSASIVIQRSHTVHLIDKEKQRKQMRTFSEYNVHQAESKKKSNQGSDESYELPNLAPPAYEHQRAFSTQLVDIDLQV